MLAKLTVPRFSLNILLGYITCIQDIYHVHVWYISYMCQNQICIKLKLNVLHASGVPRCSHPQMQAEVYTLTRTEHEISFKIPENYPKCILLEGSIYHTPTCCQTKITSALCFQSSQCSLYCLPIWTSYRSLRQRALPCQAFAKLQPRVDITPVTRKAAGPAPLAQPAQKPLSFAVFFNDISRRFILNTFNERHQFQRPLTFPIHWYRLSYDW